MEIEQILKQGEGYFTAGNLEAAKGCFQQILETDPNHIEALNNLGVIHDANGNVEGAENYFLKALAIKEDYLDALLNLVDLYQNEKRWKDAACQLEKCVLIRGDDPDLYNQLAMTYLESGNFEKARNVMIKSLDLKPEQKYIQEVLATIEDKLCSGNNTFSSVDRNAECNNGYLNILIRGGGFANKGAEAMVKTIQREMSKRLPRVRFFMEVP